MGGKDQGVLAEQIARWQLYASRQAAPLKADI